MAVIRKGLWFSILVTSFLASGIAAKAWAQYRFDEWTADNGLPQNSIRDIVQTRDGYLWLTTFDGLARFDGVRFTVFNKSNTNGIITNRFTIIYEDGQGDLWINTESGVALTRRHNGRFITYTRENGLPSPIQGLFGGDGQGNVMFFDGKQAWRWRNEHFEIMNDSPSPMPNNQFDRHDLAQHQLLGSNIGQLFIWSANQLHQLPSDFVKLRLGDPVQDWQNRIWLGSTRGLWRFEQGKLSASGIPSGKLANQKTLLITGWQPLQALTFADDGSIWITEVETGKNKLFAARPPESIKGLANLGGDIFRIYGDRENNLWFCTAHYGLVRGRPQLLTNYGRSLLIANAPADLVGSAQCAGEVRRRAGLIAAWAQLRIRSLVPRL